MQSNIKLIYIAAAFLAVIIYVFIYKPKFTALLLIIAISFALGMGRYMLSDYIREKYVEKYDGIVIKTKLTALDFASNNSFPAQINLGGERIKIYAYIENCPNIQTGDIVESEISLSLPQKDRNSPLDFAAYLSGRNIFLSAYGETAEITEEKAPFPSSVIYEIRRNLSKIAQDGFKGETRALFCAMVYGDKRFFSDELTDLLRKAGQNHIAVVSGMHLSIMNSVIMTLIGLVFGKRRIGNFIAIGAVLFLTLATGAGASVVRACIMCVLFHLAQLFRRESDALTSLSIASLVMLMYNPFAINNTGLVLSLLSVLGIILYADRFGAFFKKFMPALPASATAICLGAQTMVIPATVYYFGTIAPYAVVSNLLIFILATLLVAVGLLFAFISSIPLISVIFCAVIEILSHTIVSVCEFIGMLPAAYINVSGLSFSGVIPFVAILIAIYFYPHHKKALVKICAAAVVLFVALSISGADKIKVDILDYALGDCLFIENDGKAILIGCEESEDALQLAERKSGGVIQYAVQSSKETGDFYKLVQSGKVKSAVLNKRLCSASFVEKVKNTKTDVILLKENEDFYIDDITISYDESGSLTQNAIVKVSTKAQSIISAQSLDKEDILKLYESGKTFHSSYFIEPHHLLRTENIILSMTEEKSIVDKKQIFLKR